MKTIIVIIGIVATAALLVAAHADRQVGRLQQAKVVDPAIFKAKNVPHDMVLAAWTSPGKNDGYFHGDEKILRKVADTFPSADDCQKVADRWAAGAHVSDAWCVPHHDDTDFIRKPVRSYSTSSVSCYVVGD